jgi:hypothetical protein
MLARIAYRFWALQMRIDSQRREQARDESIIAAVFEVKKEIPAETFKLDYHGGERHPRLVRDESRPDLLGPCSRPRNA